MQLKQLINGGVLAAAVLAAGSAQAERSPFDGIVFCKATITERSGSDADDISITLPFTVTGSEGQGYTHWNLGNVPAGGVADSWHSEGGPGRFVAHNNGSVGAYVYLTSSWDEYGGDCWRGNRNSPSLGGSYADRIQEILDDIYGDVSNYHSPTYSLQHWQVYPDFYCLAFTRDITARMPTWHMLNRFYDGVWRDEESEHHWNSGYIGAYMGYLPAGDYMPFDVKFWAPREWTGAMGFTFRVEAASFPLWEHDRGIE